MPELNDKIKELMAEVEKKGDLKAVFGEPIKEGDITIIPVATIAFFQGGGGSSDDNGKGEGLMSKIKGKMVHFGHMRKARPVGYIKIQDDDAKFVPIVDKQKMAAMVIPVVGMGLTMMMIMKIIVRMKMKHHYASAE